MNTINPQQVGLHADERRRELLAALRTERARQAARSPSHGWLRRLLRQTSRTLSPTASPMRRPTQEVLA